MTDKHISVTVTFKTHPTIPLYIQKKVKKSPIKKLLDRLCLIAVLGLAMTGDLEGQIYQSLYSFNQETTDGIGPQGKLLLSGNVLYGTASSGGTTGSGTIFRINTDGSGYQTLYNLSMDDPVTNTDGGSPMGALVISGGTLYGTAGGGGIDGCGTIFALGTNGANFTVVYSFTNGSDNTEGIDGEDPNGGLVLSGNTLYGTTVAGGDDGAGVVFSVSTSGSDFTVLHSFDDSDGVFPTEGGLALSGNTLFGTTQVNNIFSINTDGSGFVNLCSLSSLTNDPGDDPIGTLLVTNGMIYGTTVNGGSTGGGAIFALRTDGSGLTNLYNFTTGMEATGPLGGLLLLGDTLYGTTEGGGAWGTGTVFSIKTNGSGFSIMHSFTNSQNAFPYDGVVPFAGLIFSGTTFYGTTYEGGSTDAGTVYEITTVYIGTTATPTNGAAPLTVNFTSPGTDNRGDLITNWQWNFGDGSTSTAQNPSHVYTSPGDFTPVLVATDASGLKITEEGPSIEVAPNGGLVLNGDFETGDFSDWTLSGDTSFTFVDNGTNSGTTPYIGTYEAELGTSSGIGYLSQTLRTVPGTSYVLSFWFENPYYDPGEFGVSWNGNTLLDTTNIDAGNWANGQYVVNATQTSTVLQFKFVDDYDYLGLDDISVLPVNATRPGFSSASLSGGNLVLVGTNGQAGGTYYLLASTNLTLPLGRWNSVATNIAGANGNFSITVTNAVNHAIPQRFFILQAP